MNPSACPAAKLSEADRINLAVLALAGTATITGPADQHDVSRKFVYEQANKASTALAEVFASSAPDDEVLFELPVTKTWLRQLTLGFTLIGHGSYRGVVELMRDLLGVRISEGTIHNVHQAAARQAGSINRGIDLSPIRVGLHDEIFQGPQPVLAGVDARSTYCYLLAAVEHRDADTRGVHLLDASLQGLNPDYTIVDAGQGLRAGQKAAWGNKPCHGDVFHIQHQCEALANTLAGIAKGAKSRRKKLQAKTRKARQDPDLADRIALALRAEAGANALAGDIRTLTGWLAHDVLALAGPRLDIRNKIFDFIVAELARRESVDPRRIRPVRIALRTSATTCSRSPAYSTTNWPRSRAPTNYFTLRRQLGGSYLDLLQFFLNHRCFLRSRAPQRVGKSPTQLMTGQDHPHWLTLLGLGPLQPQRA